MRSPKPGKQKRDKKECIDCQERKALYYSRARGKWRWDRQHTLCQRCYNALRDHHRSHDTRPKKASKRDKKEHAKTRAYA